MEVRNKLVRRGAEGARCDFLSCLTAIAPEPIWQWVFMGRVSTGLYLMQPGWRDMSRDMLKVADAWA